MDETDLFFNLRLGEIVLGTRHVPTENLLSFTYPAATDINLAWLFQVLLALAHRIGGIPGTVLLKTVFVLGTWTVLYRAALRRGAHPVVTALCLALAAWAAEPRFVERPHLVTFLGLAYTLLAIERAEEGQPRLLWLLVPLGLVWANANSCFFLAPSLLALYALGARLEGLRAAARRALGVSLALVPLMFATPSGFRCLSYIANHVRMPTLRPLQEYRHAQWPLDGPYFFLLAGLVLGALLPVVIRRLPSLVPVRVLVPCLALGVLGGLRIRFVAEFAMLAGVALAVAVARLLPRLRGRWATALAAVVLLGLTSTPRVAAALAGHRAFELGLEPELVPLSAVDFVEKNGLRDRMYNDLEVGSYLTWRGWPRYRVFQDPRINGYPDAFHAILRRADLSQREFQALLDQFGVRSALITYPTVNPRGALFAPALWALVYRATDALVFVRRSEQSTLPELPLTFSYSAVDGLAPVPIAQVPADAKVSSCEWQRRLGDYHRSVAELAAARSAYQAALAPDPETPRSGGGEEAEARCRDEARAAAGALALQLGDFSGAVGLLDGAPAPGARANHGFALLGLGRPEPALAVFEAVLAADARNDEATFGRGLCLVALGRPDQADAAFTALLARSPNHVSAPAAREQRERLRGRK
jgi:tetratricopeptide (TPR) repeat protein